MHPKGAGTDVIRIVGVEKLHKTEYSIIPDQIEAGTFMFAAAATKGDVTAVSYTHLSSMMRTTWGCHSSISFADAWDAQTGQRMRF